MRSKNSSVEELKAYLKNPPQVKAEEIAPFTDTHTKGNPELGKQLIQEKKVGCIIVAGGQGTRLNLKGPKGLFPITNVKHKTLFQLFAEKVKCAGVDLPLAIMTSPLNDKETRSYFAENNNFGLKQLDFFTQEMLPQLDQNGEPLNEAPNGNGYALKYFVESGIAEKWRGVEVVNFVLIDNPLADPFDAALIGFHAQKKADVTLKCIKRKDANEKVGVVVKKAGKIAVVEYTELPPHSPDFPIANTSLFCFSMDFVKNSASIELPLHLAFKSRAWKFETFIFDLLPFAKKVEVLLYPRETCFAPLKDNPKAVQDALLEADRLLFEKITGKAAPRKLFELDPAFYYATEEQLKKWRGTSLPENPYVLLSSKS